MNCTQENAPESYPKESAEPAKIQDSKQRSQDRPCTRNRGEMMAKKEWLFCRRIIDSISQFSGRSKAGTVSLNNLFFDKIPVYFIAQDKP
jgi:hypothetical protein